MKKKISRVKNKVLERRIPLDDRLKGIHCFHIVGPCIMTGVKVSCHFYGTRADAEGVNLIAKGVE